MDYRNDFTPAAVEARANAEAAGRYAGKILLAELVELIDNMEDMTPDFDPYLEYLIYKGCAEVIANEGRRIGGLDFRKGDNELEGKRR